MGCTESLLKTRLLPWLYSSEQYNTDLIHVFESSIEEFNAVYVFPDCEKPECVATGYEDGNSYLIRFFFTTDRAAGELGQFITDIHHPRTLLAGEYRQTKKLLHMMNCDCIPERDIVYILPSDADRSGSEPGPLLLMRAKDIDADRRLLGLFLHDFFGFSPGDARIPEKVISQHLNKGVFFLISKDEPIGMIRISATSRNYMVFTSVYIAESHRGNGFGEVLIRISTEYALGQGKIPQLTTSETNSAARRVYEKAGYREAGEYSYTFLPGAVF